nr:peptidylprolyl isomerase [Kibdelosporangium phytohabitans]
MIVVASVLVAVLVPGRGSVDGVALAASDGGTTSSKRPTTSRKTTTPPTAGATKSCQYKATPGRPNTKDVGTPTNPAEVPASGTVTITLATSEGRIPVTLDRGKAACAVHSMLFLAEKKFFDASRCHRLTTAATLKVLQCGDPSATGQGGPGYEYASEDPTDFKPAGEGVVTYPAGYVAMANAGPDTNGSQFFLVYGDSTIPPNYPVLGTFDDTGKTTLGQVVANGVGDGSQDGEPKKPVTITEVTTG